LIGTIQNMAPEQIEGKGLCNVAVAISASDGSGARVRHIRLGQSKIHQLGAIHRQHDV
jgi:hypothetical protein